MTLPTQGPPNQQSQKQEPPKRADAPFTTFNFQVEFTVSAISSQLICRGEFSEVDGLEMNMQPKTIREGGNPAGPVHLTGVVGYGSLTLKRGMTQNLDLWRWFEMASNPAFLGLRADGEIVLRSSLGGDDSVVVFSLTRCVPTRAKAPQFSAKDGQVAIEEFTIAYETMTLRLMAE